VPDAASQPLDQLRVRRASEHLQRLLGYGIWPPFMGFVNGMHPKRVLQEV
jgi:hypothetical protein